MPYLMRRLTTCLLLALALGAAAAPTASANNEAMFSIMMDDDQLLYRGDAARDAALRRMKQLGVDTARVTVLWEIVAERAKFDRRGKKRKKFKADLPGTYPKGNWDRYDRLVVACKTLGLQCYLNLTGPGPSWAHKKPPKSQARYARQWMPKAREYFKFVKAVGRRYDGTYRDENDRARVLPKVGFWSIYNEPNQTGWLMPQYKRVGSAKVPWSPVMYRELWYYGRAALDATGHGSDIVLIGETAPLGSNQTNVKSPIYPKRFIRELFCIGATGARYTGGKAAKRKCSFLAKVGNFKYTAWGHHPYTKKLPPLQRDKNRDSITMANVAELTALLDQISVTTGGILPKQNLTMMTEFGYETNPPDPFSGVSLADQSGYINLGDYIAYKDPRVLGMTQFLLRDVAGIRRYKKSSKRHWFTYQSGLQYADGKPKPSAAAYALPLVVTGRGVDSVGQDGVFLWGWLRFLPTGAKSQVSLQFKPQGAADYSTIGDPVPVTNGVGFFEAHRAIPAVPGTWRAVWVEPVSKTTIVSREVPSV
jgi:hypothetical protein